MNAMTNRTPRSYHVLASPAQATALSLGAFCAFVTAGSLVGSPVAGLLAAEIAAAVVVVTAALRINREPWREALQLRRPAWRYLAAAGLIGVSMWLINIRITLAIAERIELPLENPAMNAVALDPPWLISLLCVGLAPAICEELWFRGFWLRSLAQRWPQPLAILVISVAFSAFHLSWAQAVSTLLLSIVFARVTLRSNSIMPAMVAHFLNNACALALSRHDFAWLAKACTVHPWLSLGIASAATLVGIILIERPRSPDAP